MHSVLLHEIIFTFTFVWPLSWICSSMMWPGFQRNRAPLIFAAFLLGPIATIALLWKPFLAPWTPDPSPQSPSRPVRTDRLDAASWKVLLASCVLLLLSGIAIFYHPGWSDLYYNLIEAHSIFGLVTWPILFLFAYVHVKRHTSPTTALLTLLLMALLSVLMVTLNEMNPRYAVNLPLMAGVLFLVHVIRRRAGEYRLTTGFRAGMALLYILTLTFATGAYIAEPLNSSLNNNMGLYVLYIHGGLPLLLLPPLLAMILRHLPLAHSAATPHSPRRWKIALLILIPMFLGSSVYAHWKWFGADSGSHVWPPGPIQHLYQERSGSADTVEYRTDSGPPGQSQRDAYPAGYEHTLNDHTVCANSGCHPSLVRQWEFSSHRFAADDVFFTKVLQRMAEEKGDDSFNTYCLNCHDPVGVLHPDPSFMTSQEHRQTQLGITCKSCHTMTSVTKGPDLGSGAYALRPEIPYSVSIGDPDDVRRWAWFIRRDLRLHFKNYSNPLLFQSGEQCAACHRATLPEYLTGRPDMVVADVYSSWARSPYPARGQTCLTCHMPPTTRDERGVYFPDHRFPGFNVSLSTLIERDDSTIEGVREFEAYSRVWLEGKAPRSMDGPSLDVEVTAPPLAHPGETVPILVDTTNSRVGHYFPSGPSTLNEIWLELTLTDSDGRVLFQSGFLDKDGEVEPSARRLGGEVMGSTGEIIRDCAVWKAVGVVGGRRLEPFQSLRDRFSIHLPGNTIGPIEIRARWNYRRARQSFVNWVFDDTSHTMPVVSFASASTVIQVEP